MAVTGIDLSLTGTGVAIFDGETTKTHLITSKGGRSDTLSQRNLRLVTIARSVIDLLVEFETDGFGSSFISDSPELVVIEAPSYGSKYGSQHDRSGLWWMIVRDLIDLGIPVTAVTPNGRAKYATGRGNASKDEVLSAAIRRYTDVDITNNNVADAVVLCAMGVRWLDGLPLMDIGLPEKNLEAMAGVEWPAA